MLIPPLGVRGSAIAAAGLNLAAAAGALTAAYAGMFRAELESGGLKSLRGHERHASGDRSFALKLYAVAGGIALGYEIIWSQVLVQLTSTRSFAFAVVLATYLTGLAAGSVIFARHADRARDGWGVFGLLIGSAGLLALLLVTLLGGWVVWLQSFAEWHTLAWTGSALAGMCARFAVAAAVVVLPPTLLLGAAFPSAVRLTVREGQIGRDVGATVALNTAGAIVGTLVAGFVLVPAVGLVRALGTLSTLAAVTGWAAARRDAARSRMMPAASTVLLATVIVATLVLSNRIARVVLDARGGGDRLAFYGESAGGTVAVIDQDAGPASSNDCISTACRTRATG